MKDERLTQESESSWKDKLFVCGVESEYCFPIEYELEEYQYQSIGIGYRYLFSFLHFTILLVLVTTEAFLIRQL